MAQLEAVMTVELKIRGPYPIGEERLAVNIESGSLAGFGEFAGKLSGSVIAPSGDVIVLQKSGTFERNVRLIAEMGDGSFPIDGVRWKDRSKQRISAKSCTARTD